MQILSRQFLAPYYKHGDLFPNLLARTVYFTLYKRPEDQSWTDTIKRVVIGNCALDPNITEEEAQNLFHLFWTMQALPAGRCLWVCGVPNIPHDAAFNCWYSTINSIDDWGFVANQLMLGGGVGVGLENIDRLPAPEPFSSSTPCIQCNPYHADFNEVAANYIPSRNDHPFVVEDSREGWVNALLHTMNTAMRGNHLHIDISNVRKRGDKLRTFGGTACGSGPLVEMIRNVWGVIRSAGMENRKLTAIDGLDITNYIGKCVKAGNVRRSALLCLGSSQDEDFWGAKQDMSKVISHRHVSNNSFNIHSKEECQDLNWKRFIEANLTFGDPGINNIWRGQRIDPEIEGVNPCGEIQLRNRESCNLAEVFPALFTGSHTPEEIFKLVTRFSLRQRLLPFTDTIAENTRAKTMRLGVGLGGLCDFQWSDEQLKSYYDTVRIEANNYADALRVNRPITVTTVKPSGSISLLNGSSPGIHAAEAPFYIRRMRLIDGSPMVDALIAAGVPCEQSIDDKHTLVFSFPIKTKQGAHTLQNETLSGQFLRQRKAQKHWADNSVSVTIRFKQQEIDELETLLQKHAHKLKGVALLADVHKYAQAPYEATTETQFNQLSAVVNHKARLAPGEIDYQECGTGGCPVR